jgi:hypothetical protein
VTEEQIRAEEHLRVIRSLMERATLYRAISAPTALVGGLCALGVSGWALSQAGYIGHGIERALTTRSFITPWLIALLITGGANAFFISREARRDGRAFISAGLRLAIRSIVPSVFLAAAITFVVWRNELDPDGPTILGLSWIGLYGLGLLATMNFAPRSLVILGGSFVFVSVLWLMLLSSPWLPEIDEIRGYVGGTFAMGLTFGLFHLLYAIGTWTTRSSAANPSTAQE